jgi:hypothetical protein
MRDITANEQLTHDWATTDDLEYEMRCNCGSANCRGTITGKDWMKEDLQEKYKGWFCWFLQRKIDALSSNKPVEQTALRPRFYVKAVHAWNLFRPLLTITVGRTDEDRNNWQ